MVYLKEKWVSNSRVNSAKTDKNDFKIKKLVNSDTLNYYFLTIVKLIMYSIKKSNKTLTSNDEITFSLIINRLFRYFFII